MRSCIAAVAALSLLLEAGCSRSAQSYLEKGNKFFEARQYDDAAIQYRKAFQRDPNFGEAYYRLGLTAMEQNRGTEAYQPLYRAVQLMPNNDAAKVKLADVSLAIYVVAPQHPKALYQQIEQLADALLARNANSFDGLRLKGSLRLLDRNPKEAIEFFRKADQIEPKHPELAQSWVQALFEDNRVSEGEQMALEVIGRDKTFGAMYDVLYTEYTTLNRSADAESVLKTKIANNPKNEDFIIQLARHYASTNRPVEMTSTLQRVLSDSADFPDAPLKAGNLYASLGQWDQAFSLFQDGARSQPKEKLIYQKRMADVLLAQGKRTDALRLVDLILKDAPKDDEAHRVHATLMLDSPDGVAAARTELTALVTSKPGDPQTRFLLGRAYLAEGNISAARNEFQQVVELRPEEIPARFALAKISLDQGKPEEALRYANEILALNPANDDAKLIRITAMIGAGQYSAARSELAHLQAQYPKSPDVQIELGILAIAEKKYGEAEAIFRKLDQVSSNDPRGVEGLVETYSAQNQLERALGVLTDDLKRSPDSPVAHRLLALTAARAHKYDLAITEYKALLAKDPKSSALATQLSQVYQLKGDLPDAISVLQQAQQSSPNDPDSLMLLGSMLQSAGRNSEAHADYQRALELRPDNPFVLNNIAFLMADGGGNLDEALGLSQRALQKAPGHPVLTDTLGWIYLKKGMKDSAVRTFSSLVRQHPESSVYHYHFGLALLQSGDKAKAKAELETALANQPSPEDETKIREALSSLRG